MKELTEYKDFAGRPIRQGDVVAYPVRRGSSMVLKEATVWEQPGKGCAAKEGLVCLSPDGKRVIIGRPDRCVVFSDFSKRKKHATVRV